MTKSSNKTPVYQTLEKLHIPYQEINHPPVFTTQEADQYPLAEGVCHSKNLFLRNKKKTHYYLVVMEAEKQFDMKKFASLIGESRLSFASPDDLMKYLQITPGSVSPFTLIHTTGRNVQVVIDQDLMEYTKAGFHPNDNTATLIISTHDFKKYLDFIDNKIDYLKL